MAYSETGVFDRVISLIDMDCFYVQVEENECPQYKGQPCGVSQYNPYRGGGLIAVNYEARKFNVKRGMRGEQAKAICPNFHTFYVKQNRGKADLTKYREASMKIFDVIVSHCPNVEKASIDEAYLDLTDIVEERLKKLSGDYESLFRDSYVVGTYAVEENTDIIRENNLKAWLKSIPEGSQSSDAKLAMGALIVNEIRANIKENLGFNCSAGIAHNKTLAKLCCGINKPNKQTILPLSAHEGLMAKTPIQKIKNLGGKLGVILTEDMSLKTMGDLASISLSELSKQFGEKTGNWLYQISHGIDLEVVVSRQIPKSIGCSKNFPGKSGLNTFAKVSYWVSNLSEELEERLISDGERNQREAKSLVINVTNKAGSFSKTTHITKYCKIQFAELSMESLKAFNKSLNSEFWQPSINTLGMSAKFSDSDKKKGNVNPLLKYFTNKPDKLPIHNKIDQDSISEQLNISTEDTHKKPSKNSSEVLSDEISQMSAALIASNQPTTSKNADESDLDAENFDFNVEDNDVIVEKALSPSNKNLFKVDSVEKITNEIDNVDYIKCEKCHKKILVWEFPEHEDFHFAQELSKQICMPTVASNVLTASKEENKNKKRAISDTPNKSESSDNSISKKTIMKAKKLKTDSEVKSKKKSIKPIENYFKKK